MWNPTLSYPTSCPKCVVWQRCLDVYVSHYSRCIWGVLIRAVNFRAILIISQRHAYLEIQSLTEKLNRSKLHLRRYTINIRKSFIHQTNVAYDSYYGIAFSPIHHVWFYEKCKMLIRSEIMVLEEWCASKKRSWHVLFVMYVNGYIRYIVFGPSVEHQSNLFENSLLTKSSSIRTSDKIRFCKFFEDMWQLWERLRARKSSISVTDMFSLWLTAL